MKSSKRILYSRTIFIAGIILLTSLSALFLYETRQEDASSAIVYNANVKRQSLEKINSLLRADQASFRGFLLTKDSATFRSSNLSHQIEGQLKVVDSLISDNQVQRANFEKLLEYYNESQKRQEALALKFKEKDYPASSAFPKDITNSSLAIDSIGALIGQMQGIEEKLSESLSMEVQKHTVIATMVGVAASIFSMIVFIIAFYFIDQELKRSQNYINQAEELNSKIAEINLELEEANRNLLSLNDELESKNFQLEKYAKELSSFTHITSHDMQEPLRKIEFFISIVEDREQQNLSEEGQRFLGKIKRSVGRMRQLFLSMLDFSLINTVDHSEEEIDLNEVLSQTLNSFKIYIKDTNAIIETDPLPKVKGVKYQLVQLFENIVSNAIKFRKVDIIPELHITSVRVDTALQQIRGLKNDTEYYKIDFRDNGVGFDPGYSEKIFEIFQRLNSKTDTFGAGIGLAICRRIAANHGGILMADSQLNKGSVFTLYLPVSSQPANFI